MTFHTVSMGAIVRNEGPYLLEWISHHHLLGVQHFYIYDHESTDATRTILTALQTLGLVTYVHWEDRPGCHQQLSAYEDIISRFRDSTEWIGFLDLDEFLVLHRHPSVGEFLRDYSTHGGVAINWRLFGSAGKEHFEDRPVVERFTRASRSDFSPNLHVKSFVKIAQAAVLSPHLCAMKGAPIVDTLFQPLPAGSHGVHTAVSWEVAQVNHYFCKSREEFLMKSRRGEARFPLSHPNRTVKGIEYFENHDRNDVEDLSLARRLPEIRAKMSELKAACGLS